MIRRFHVKRLALRVTEWYTLRLSPQGLRPVLGECTQIRARGAGVYSIRRDGCKLRQALRTTTE